MKVKELMELLAKCPQDDILMAYITEVGCVDLTDVWVGLGPDKDLTYLNIKLDDKELD